MNDHISYQKRGSRTFLVLRKAPFLDVRKVTGYNDLIFWLEWQRGEIVPLCGHCAQAEPVNSSFILESPSSYDSCFACEECGDMLSAYCRHDDVDHLEGLCKQGIYCSSVEHSEYCENNPINYED